MQIFKRRALIGKQTVVHLINFVVKRTVVLLNPSFKNFIYPRNVICYQWVAQRLEFLEPELNMVERGKVELVIEIFERGI